MRTILILSIFLYSFNTITLNDTIQNNKVAYFINHILEDAQRVSKEKDIPLELILAQCCLESGYGTSRLSIQQCNYLGIRPGGKYATYQGISECLDHYGRVLCQPCYENLQPKSLDEWIDALECCHYASSTEYRSKLKWIIHKFKLKLL